jgi:hypothetical protein
MKMDKKYDKDGNLISLNVDLTAEESQPDWIREAAKERKKNEENEKKEE